MYSINSSLGIALQQDERRGRHLVTIRAFKAGELVLAQEPYAAVLQDSQVPLRCDHCYHPHPDLAQCARSKLARYCSRAHQKAAWGNGYREECQALVATQPSGRTPTATMRLVARCVWKAINERASSSQQDSPVPLQVSSWPAPGGSWSTVISLLDHWGVTPASQQILYSQVAAAAREYALAGVPASSQQPPTDTTPDTTAQSQEGWDGDGAPSVRVLAHLVARLVANSHTLHDEELRPLGMGLYPLAAMANHSDDPSCLQSFQGSTICFRALRDLPVGTEVTISYIELGTTRQQRREALWDQYRYDSQYLVPVLGNTQPAGTGHPDKASVPRGAETHDTDALQDTGRTNTHVQAQMHAVTQAAPNMQSSGQPASIVLRPPPLALYRWTPHTGWAHTDTATDTAAHQPAAQHSDLPQILLRVYPCGPAGASAPDWPCDPADQQLTEVVVQGSGWTGGVQARLVQDSEAASSQLFEGLLDGDEGSTQPAQSPQAVQQQLVCEVDCWGTWTQHSQASACPTAAAAAPVAHLQAVAVLLTGAVGALRQVEGLRKTGQHAAALTAVSVALKQLDCLRVPGPQGAGQVVVRLGDRHLLRKQLLDAQLQTAIEASNVWSEALQAAQALTPFYDLCYAKMSPQRGLHYASLAKLEALVGSLEAAVAAAERALEVLSVTHGSGAWGAAGAAVCQEVARVRWEAMQELRGQM